MKSHRRAAPSIPFTNRAMRALLAGGAATTAMSAVMIGWQQAAGGGRLAPRLITERGLAGAGLRPETEAGQWTATAVAHYGVGCGSAAAYQVADAVLGNRLSDRPAWSGALAGAASGLLIWALAYGAAIPALQLLPPPEQDRAGRQSRLVVAHLVYGAVLGTVSVRHGER